MDKSSLLEQLAKVRARAEAAHLEIVIHAKIVAELKKEGRDASAAKVQLNIWKMTEQKLIIQMNLILDQLDQVGR